MPPYMLFTNDLSHYSNLAMSTGVRSVPNTKGFQMLTREDTCRCLPFDHNVVFGPLSLPVKGANLLLSPLDQTSEHVTLRFPFIVDRVSSRMSAIQAWAMSRTGGETSR